MKFTVNGETYSDIPDSDIYPMVEIEEAFKEFLDALHGDIHICGYDYPASEALESVDPVAFRCAEADYISEYWHGVRDETGRIVGYIQDSNLDDLEPDVEGD